MELQGFRKIYVSREPVHMGKSFDSLELLARSKKVYPAKGDMIIFKNRKRDTLKALIYQGEGRTILHRKLKKGQFSALSKRHIQISELEPFFGGEESYDKYSEIMSCSKEATVKVRRFNKK